MGASGTGPFENDDAGDWLFELEESPDGGAILAALQEVTEKEKGEELEAGEAANAIAAAEMVAALHGFPLADLPDNAREWVDGHEELEVGDWIPLALTAVERVRKNSELKELWDESKDSKKWHGTLDNLVKRLNA